MRSHRKLPHQHPSHVEGHGLEHYSKEIRKNNFSPAFHGAHICPSFPHRTVSAFTQAQDLSLNSMIPDGQTLLAPQSIGCSRAEQKPRRALAAFCLLLQ